MYHDSCLFIRKITKFVIVKSLGYFLLVLRGAVDKNRARS